MPYVFLLVAIACEVVATSLLKATEGFPRRWPTVEPLSSQKDAGVLSVVGGVAVLNPGGAR